MTARELGPRQFTFWGIILSFLGYWLPWFKLPGRANFFSGELAFRNYISSLQDDGLFNGAQVVMFTLVFFALTLLLLALSFRNDSLQVVGFTGTFLLITVLLQWLTVMTGFAGMEGNTWYGLNWGAGIFVMIAGQGMAIWGAIMSWVTLERESETGWYVARLDQRVQQLEEKVREAAKAMKPVVPGSSSQNTEGIG